MNVPRQNLLRSLLPLLLLFAGLSLAGCGAKPAPEAPPGPAPAPWTGTTAPTALVRDFGWVFEGYAPKWLVARRQAERAERARHHVPRDLPAVEFDTLKRVMLTDGDPVVASDVRALEGKRVRLEGRALPLDELAEAKEFVLHDAPFVRCVHVATPATNRQVLVRLTDGTFFDFTDAPLMVEGTLRIGRFETFAEGDIALYALDDARVEVLPALDEEMVIGVEHSADSHAGELRLPVRRGPARVYDPGGEGHEHEH